LYQATADINSQALRNRQSTFLQDQSRNENVNTTFDLQLKIQHQDLTNRLNLICGFNNRNNTFGRNQMMT